MKKLWKIKLWLKHEPTIFFYLMMGKLFEKLSIIIRWIGEKLYGREKFEYMVNEDLEYNEENL